MKMPTLETAARNAACNAIVDLIDAGSGAGTLEFETSGDVEVATLTFSDPAFGDAATGVATASSITSDTNATGGTVAQASMYDSDSNKVMECTVSTSGADINLSSLTVGAGDTVSCSSLTVTVPAS
jgi:hypothetical protein